MSIFIPKENEGYWHITSFGDVVFRKFIRCSPIDIHNELSSNCYHTEEDAVRARNRDYVLRELQILLNVDSKEDAYFMLLDANVLDTDRNKLGEEKLKLILDIKE